MNDELIDERLDRAYSWMLMVHDRWVGEVPDRL
jgi:hypothetical protein